MLNRQLKTTLTAIGAASLGLLLAQGCSQNSPSTSRLPNSGQTGFQNQPIDGRVVLDSNGYPLPNQPSVDPNFPQRSGEYTESPLPPQDRHVNVRAPFVNLDVNRESGAVHLNTPFARVDTFGRGRGAQIDIPRTRVSEDGQIEPTYQPTYQSNNISR